MLFRVLSCSGGFWPSRVGSNIFSFFIHYFVLSNSHDLPIWTIITRNALMILHSTNWTVAQFVLLCRMPGEQETCEPVQLCRCEWEDPLQMSPDGCRSIISWTKLPLPNPGHHLLGWVLTPRTLSSEPCSHTNVSLHDMWINLPNIEVCIGE